MITFMFLLMIMIAIAMAAAAEMAFALHLPLLATLFTMASTASILLTVWIMIEAIRPASSR